MPKSFCLRGNLILPDAVLPDSYLLVEDGRITDIAREKPKSFSGTVENMGSSYVSPGYIDIHVHGGAGADYMDGTAEAIRTANRAHLRHGTTTILPTTTTGSPEQLRKMLKQCAAVQADWSVKDGAFIGGVHFYGPYFAEDKVGCHGRDGRRNPDSSEYNEFFQMGIIRVATCAAELEGCDAFYQEAQARGCLVTCGHSNASWKEMERAFENGVRHVDHFWCAMSSVSSMRERFGTPMQGSMEQFVLAQPEMSTEVIADGQHLAPELLEFAYKMKGPHRLLLVTDCNRALDMPPGRYRFGPEEDGPWIESDGKVGFVRGEGLASSVVGMDRMVQVMARHCSAPLQEVVRMASLTPAERCGLAKETGSLEAGKWADVLLLDEHLHVKSVFVRGQEAELQGPSYSPIH